MQAAHALSDPMFVKSVEQIAAGCEGGGAACVRDAVRVTGYARTNLDARLVYSAKLDYQEIWGAKQLPQE